MPDFKALGQTGSKASKELETFPTPPGFSGPVTFSTPEFTSLCPVTGQPDYCSLTIEIDPLASCVESKSLKLYLMSFRDEGHFAEALAAMIASDIGAATQAYSVKVTVDQNPRGGIRLVAESQWFGAIND